MSIPTAYLDKLLKCAITYHHKPVTDIEPIPSSEQSLSKFKLALQKSMEFEAHIALRNKIPAPVDQTLFPVNISTKEPGIVAGMDEHNNPVYYTPSRISKKPADLKKERQRADKQLDKWVKREFKKQDKMKERIAKKKEKLVEKKVYQSASPEEKKIIREKRRLEREQKKQLSNKKKTLQKPLTELNKDKKSENTSKIDKTSDNTDISNDFEENLTKNQSDLVKESPSNLESTPTPPVINENEDENEDENKSITKKESKSDINTTDNSKKLKSDMNTTDNSKKTKSGKKEKAKPKTIEEEEKILEEGIKALDKFLYGDDGEIQPTDDIEIDEKGNTIYNFYESPVTFNRSISALEFCSPRDDFIPTLLEGKPNKNIRLYHGPPGTGKTYRLISELIYLSSRKPNHRFLVCAQSNVGTANMFDRAIKRGIQGSLIMAKNKIPKEIFVEKDSQNPLDRIVFCTVASRNSFKLKREEFQHIFLDEAAQTIEAHLWGLLRPEVESIRMAGDPDQLPALVSSEGEKLHHGRSMMERLMSINYPAELLDIQRRMHPKIVEFPNRQFYMNKLKTEYKVHPEIEIEPFKVIHVNGEEKTKGSSFYNIEEIKKIEEIVISLSKTFNEDEIVIITGYSAQVELLRKKFKYVHTVDSFQGREASAIILSTVRSGDSIGFWKDYRRVNVAMTRAKHVLRIVGNTETWKKDKCCLTELVTD